MQLYLIRHGQSENNGRPEHLRVEDAELTDLGHQQAEQATAGAVANMSSHMPAEEATAEFNGHESKLEMQAGGVCNKDRWRRKL